MTRCLPSRHGLAGASFSDQGPGRPRSAGPGPVRGSNFGKWCGENPLDPADPHSILDLRFWPPNPQE